MTVECNWKGLDSTGHKIIPCNQAPAAKCRVCSNFTCADHKYTLGPISQGVTITSCHKCYVRLVRAGANHTAGARYQKYVEPSENPFKVLLKVKNNLCCVLNPVQPCKCGHKICARCFNEKIKPHNECEYIYNRKLLAWAKKTI